MQHYQEKSWEYALDSAKNSSYLFSGLAGEVGELCSLFAKGIRDQTGTPSDDFVKEAGDCLWFLAALCTHHGVSLEYIAEANLNKLHSRKERNKLGGSGDNR